MICPWAHQYSNLISYEHQTVQIAVPDVCPSDNSSVNNFSMSAGDFLEVYTRPGKLWGIHNGGNIPGFPGGGLNYTWSQTV